MARDTHNAPKNPRALVEFGYDRKTGEFTVSKRAPDGPDRQKLATATEAAFNDAGGYLTIRVSSPVPDRDNEVIIPETIRLDNYQRNPVVLPFHSQEVPPIALCEDANGKFWCWLDDSGSLWQRWYFDSSPEGVAFAGLYQRKILRSASIGFRPDGYSPITPREAMQKYGVEKRLNVCIGGELLETSAVPVPACPASVLSEWVDADALGSIVSRGYVGSEKMPEMVVKGLLPYAAKYAFYRTNLAKETTAKRVWDKLRKNMACKTSNTVAQCYKSNKGKTIMAETVVEKDAKKDAVVVTQGNGTVVTLKAESDSMPADNGADTTNADDMAAMDPHEDVKAGLMSAMANCMGKFFNGECSWDETTTKLSGYADDFMKYNAGEEKAEDEMDDDPEDSELDEEIEEKSGLVDELKAFMAECRTKFSSIEEFQATAAELLNNLVK